MARTTKPIRTVLRCDRCNKPLITPAEVQWTYDLEKHVCGWCWGTMTEEERRASHPKPRKAILK